MYAHQVVDDLKMVDTNDFSTKFAKSEIEKMIKNSVKFHVGDLSNGIQKIMADRHGEPAFREESAIEHLPYKLCLIDYTTQNVVLAPGKFKSSRHGILALDSNTTLVLWLFTYFDIVGRWVPGPVFYTINKTIGSMNLGPLLNIYAELAKPEGEQALKLQLEEDNHEISVFNIVAMLLTCKNIVIETVIPSEKLNKKRRKKGKTEIFEYKTLNVFLPRKSKSSGDLGL
jgi:hypothetical protein